MNETTVIVHAPLSLLLAPIPNWAKLVWLSIKSYQGHNDYAWPSLEKIGERAINAKGNPMDRSQVARAIKVLESSGFLKVIGRKKYRCLMPPDPVGEAPFYASFVDESANYVRDEGTYVEPEEVDDPSTNCIQEIDDPSTLAQLEDFEKWTTHPQKVDDPSTKVDDPSTSYYKKKQLKETRKNNTPDDVVPDAVEESEKDGESLPVKRRRETKRALVSEMTFDDDDWRRQYSEAFYQRLEARGKLSTVLSKNPEKTIHDWCHIFRRLEAKLDRDKIRLLCSWLFSESPQAAWWIDGGRLGTAAKLLDKTKAGDRYIYELLKIQMENEATKAKPKYSDDELFSRTLELLDADAS